MHCYKISTVRERVWCIGGHKYLLIKLLLSSNRQLCKYYKPRHLTKILFLNFTFFWYDASLLWLGVNLLTARFIFRTYKEYLKKKVRFLDVYNLLTTNELTMAQYLSALRKGSKFICKRS